jgi:hypothetical protein
MVRLADADRQSEDDAGPDIGQNGVCATGNILVKGRHEISRGSAFGQID